jgi:hypothetical protein
VGVGVASWLHDWIAGFRGSCLGQPPRLRLAEFLYHAIDTCLARVAIVTIDTHRRTLAHGIPVGLS